MYDVKTSLPLPDTSPPEPAAEPSWQPLGEAAPAHRRFYVPVRVKYVLILLASLAWAAMSVKLSQPWLNELSKPLGFGLALFVIAFIAYVPGFMNAFLIGSILSDRRPVLPKYDRLPDVCVLVACYNESENIADTLTSLARQDYPGSVEVVVIDDGSTDDSLAIARAMAAKGAIGSDELTRAQENLRKEHEANVAAIQERLEPGKQLLKDLQFELDLMKLTNAERATAIQLRGLDTEQIQKYGDAIAETNRKIMENAEQADFMDGWRGEFQDFFSDVLTGTKSIGDAFEDMLSNISAMIAERIAQNWVDQLFGQMGTTNGGAAGGGDGGWLSGLASIFSSFGGSRAGGGDVLANRGYWVGEQGPEWFQPRTAGTVLTTDESMGMARGRSNRPVVITNNMTVQGRIDRQTETQIAREMGIRAQVAMRRNG